MFLVCYLMGGRRSKNKGPYVASSFLRALKRRERKASDKDGTLVIHTKSRSTTIIPEFVNKLVYVYNGRKFIPVLVTEKIVGHKFGEFAPTRTFKGHSGSKKSG